MPEPSPHDAPPRSLFTLNARVIGLLALLAAVISATVIATNLIAPRTRSAPTTIPTASSPGTAVPGPAHTASGGAASTTTSREAP